MEGWKGGEDGSKVMVFEVDMPHCGSDGVSECTWDRPAVWALNSKVGQMRKQMDFDFVCLSLVREPSVASFPEMCPVAGRVFVTSRRAALTNTTCEVGY